MKIRTVLIGLLLFIGMTGAASAEDPAEDSAEKMAGKWIVTADNVDLELDITISGDKVKGKVYNPLSGKWNIKDGKRNGDTISFVVNVQPNLRQTFRVAWKGHLQGEVMIFTRVNPLGKTDQVIGVRPEEKEEK